MESLFSIETLGYGVSLIGIPGWAMLINTSFIFVGKALVASNLTQGCQLM